MKQPTLQFESRDEWLMNRKRGIGASDVPVILGMTPKSPLTLYYEKRGVLENVSDDLCLRYGHYMEPFVADEYQRNTGIPLVDPGDHTIWHHSDYPWLFATPDRIAAPASGERWAVELKTISPYMAAKLTDDGDIKHQIQVQIQMACMDLDRADLAALIGNTDFRVFKLYRHDRALKNIISKCAEFWERVENGDPPEADGSESTQRTLFLLHPKDSGATVMVSKHVSEEASKLKEIKEQISALESEKRRIEAEIKHELKDATYGEDSLGQLVSWKTVERSGRITIPYSDDAVKKLQESGIDHEITQPTEYRRLTVKQR